MNNRGRNPPNRRNNIQVLQALVGKPAQSLGRPAYEMFASLGHNAADAVLCGGIRRDALHEVFAAAAGEEAAATGFALALASRANARHTWLLWVRQDFSALESGEIHGCGLLELGIDPSHLLIVRTPDATAVLRAGTEGLACKGLGAVIIESWGAPNAFDLLTSRKLTLAAQQYGIPAIMLRLGARPQPSTAETRWLIKAAVSSPNDDDWGKPVFDAALARNRHGRTGRWVMEWDGDDGIFCATAAHFGTPAAIPFDGPVEAPMARQAG